MKLSVKDFFSKCDQIRRKMWIWSHLLKKSLMENFIFCAVTVMAKGQSSTLGQLMNRLEYFMSIMGPAGTGSVHKASDIS